jgi:RNA polymerase sigma-70 factor (ECF subfamily)
MPGTMKDLQHQAGSDEGQPATATSRSLLAGVQAHDDDAWDRLVKLYAPLVYHWCLRWGLRQEDAADVFQEVFLSVSTHIAAFHKERAGDTFRGWLRTITRNKVLDHFRRLGREPAGVGGTDAQRRLSDLPASEAAPEPEPADDQAELSLFYRGLDVIRAEFEPRTWEAFWKTTVEGRAPKDVAPELSMSPGAVRVAKSRVLQRLRQELGELLG